MDISFNRAGNDEDRRRRLYRGELTILPPSASSLALAVCSSLGAGAAQPRRQKERTIARARPEIG